MKGVADNLKSLVDDLCPTKESVSRNADMKRSVTADTVASNPSYKPRRGKSIQKKVFALKIIKTREYEPTDY